MTDPIGTVRYNPTNDYFLRRIADEPNEWSEGEGEWAVYFRGFHDTDEENPRENMFDYEVGPQFEHLLAGREVGPTDETLITRAADALMRAFPTLRGGDFTPEWFDKVVRTVLEATK